MLYYRKHPSSSLFFVGGVVFFGLLPAHDYVWDVLQGSITYQKDFNFEKPTFAKNKKIQTCCTVVVNRNAQTVLLGKDFNPPFLYKGFMNDVYEEKEDLKKGRRWVFSII
jgi:hypothetical protein